MKYRKKPVVIEAIQFVGTYASGEAIEEWTGKVVSMATWNVGRDTCSGMIASTLEGPMRVSVGDFVIRGVQGEFYACKPDIFEQTYEAVEGEHIDITEDTLRAAMARHHYLGDWDAINRATSSILPVQTRAVLSHIFGEHDRGDGMPFEHCLLCDTFRQNWSPS